MRGLGSLVCGLFLCSSVLVGCADSSSELVRELPAQWVVGGGTDVRSTSAAGLDLRSDVARDGARVVADDGAFWTVRSADSVCAGLPTLTWDDGVVRVAPDGAVTDVSFDFVDPSKVEGADPNDCAAVVEGPVSAGNGAVLVTMSSDEAPVDRRWWQTYLIDSDGEVTLWEPLLPEGFRVVGLGRSATSQVLVIGGYRQDWDGDRWEGQAPLDSYQLFVVNPETMASSAIEPTTGLNAAGEYGVGAETDPTKPWMNPSEYSLALLADGRLVYWSIKSGPGLWVQSDDGQMMQLIDSSPDAVQSNMIRMAGPGSPIGTISDLAGSDGWDLDPMPDGRLLFQVLNAAFSGLDADAYRVQLEGEPEDSLAQDIVDTSFTAEGTTIGLQAGIAPPWVSVVIGSEALAGDAQAPITLINVGSSSPCVSEPTTTAICGIRWYVAEEEDRDLVNAWVYYRVAVPDLVE